MDVCVKKKLYFILQSGYQAPDPPVFSGEHRYMIFAYEQLEIEIEVLQPDSRAKFDPIAWMESFGGEDTDLHALINANFCINVNPCINIIMHYY